MADARLNLVVLRSPDVERARRFYEQLGLTFTQHRHGNGPEHYASEGGSVVFEIYPADDAARATAHARLGFQVPSVDEAIAHLRAEGTEVVSAPKESPWGRRAVVADPDGHRVELIESA
jgi:predicted enzyme related to lactoylglutathione lyase